MYVMLLCHVVFLFVVDRIVLLHRFTKSHIAHRIRLTISDCGSFVTFISPDFGSVETLATQYHAICLGPTNQPDL